MQYNTKNSNKVTALYARFSRNDSDNESDSIANQRKILQNYAREKGFTRTKFYADDGISGTTFDRPDFQRLLTDIENGEVKTVIVKDLSRFGRLSSMVGYYTDFYFPVCPYCHIDDSLLQCQPHQGKMGRRHIALVFLPLR